MRNWNSHASFPSPFGALSFGFTYEELKHRVSKKILSGAFDVSDLPMRNWNLIHVSIVSILQLEFRIYLWGIETRAARPAVGLRDSPFRIYLWGIETSHGKACEATCWMSFGFTYEELKLPRFSAILAPTIVSDLPMRNWNWKLARMRRRSSFVSDLPMRNWNWRISDTHRRPGASFGFTYEELKPLFFL